MYGPKGIGRSGFGAFTAKKRAEQAAADEAVAASAADHLAPARPVDGAPSDADRVAPSAGELARGP